MSKESKEIYEFGLFRLDVDEHIFLRTDGQKCASLPEKAFQTLVVLVRNNGRLVTKSELLEAVWPDSFVEENNLDKAVHAIRNALRENAGDVKFIETVRKHGYRFSAEVRHVRPVGVTGTDTVNSVNTARSVVLKPQLTASGQHAVTDLLALRPINDPGTSDDPDRGEPVVAALKSHSSNKRRGAFFQVVVASLGLGILGVAAWMFSGLGLGLGRPTNKADPAPVSRVMADVSVGERSAAYDLYVRGKVKVASENRNDTEAAIKLLEEAVRLDPNFAEAFAALARGYNTMAFKYSSDDERRRYHEDAEVAIAKALELNPDLAEAHFARGLILWTNTKSFPHERAIQSYRRSIALDPNLDEAYHQLSLVYSHIGFIEEADASVKKALELNPNNTMARFRAGVYLQYQGKFEEAIAVFKTIPRDVTPLLMDRSLAETLIQTGRLSEAGSIVDAYLQKFPQDEGGSFTSMKALLLAKAGKQAEAVEQIDRAYEIGKGFGHFHHTAYNIASAYAAMNRPADAVKWLEVAAEQGFPNGAYFEIDPNLEGIRDEAGFLGLMERLRSQRERMKGLV